VKVNTGFPSISPNTSWRTRPLSPSQDESMVKSSTALPSSRTVHEIESGIVATGPNSTLFPESKLEKTPAGPQSSVAPSGPLYIK
jgi:hypothetical protein